MWGGGKYESYGNDLRFDISDTERCLLPGRTGAIGLDSVSQSWIAGPANDRTGLPGSIDRKWNKVPPNSSVPSMTKNLYGGISGV